MLDWSCYEDVDKYIIVPEHLKKFYKTKGVLVPESFVYNSNNNEALISKSALKNILKNLKILQ